MSDQFAKSFLGLSEPLPILSIFMVYSLYLAIRSWNSLSYSADHFNSELYTSSLLNVAIKFLHTLLNLFISNRASLLLIFSMLTVKLS